MPYAVPLRPSYRIHVLLSVSAVLLLLIGVFRADLPQRGLDELSFQLPATQEIIEMEDVIVSVQELPPPPAPAAFVEVADEEALEEMDISFDAAIDMSAPQEIAPPPMPAAPPPPPSAPKAEPEPEVFIVVEEMPSIKGGTASLYGVLEYPEMARRANIEGRVVVQVVINPSGRASNPVVLRSANEMLDQAAVDAVLKLDFIPGKQRGRAVPVQYAIPITFRLRSE
jgi:protein TonB